MSSDLRSVASNAPVPRAAGTLPGDSSASQGGQGLDFSAWMAQHREAPPETKLVQAQPIQAPSAQPRPSRADRPAVSISQAVAAPRADTAPPATQVRPPVAKAPPKAAPKQPTATAQKAATPAPPNKAPKASTEGAHESEAAREVTFKTAQGEASAWVQELHPPPDIPTADPAAMLAWLASLTQADAALGEGQAATSGQVAEPGDTGRDTRGLATRPDAASGGATAAGLAIALASGQGQPGGQGASAGDEADRHFAQALAQELAQTGAGDKPATSIGQNLPTEFARLSPAAGDAPRHYTGSLNAPVGSPQFGPALAERVSLWVSGPAASGPMTAELRLNPAEMGPVQIRIEIDGTQAMVDFAAAHADTREAIEGSLSLLSSALEDIGLSLTGGGVSDQGAQPGGAGRGDPGSPGDRRPVPWGSMGITPPEQPMDSAGAAMVPRHGRPGGLDLYA